MGIRSFLVFFPIFLLVLAACSDSSSFEVSDEMKVFTKMIQGDYTDVSKALEKYAARDELKTHNITMYDLDDGQITAREGDCYTVEFKAGITTRVYRVCWKNKKITELESLGIQ